MNKADYQKALKAAEVEIHEILQKRAALDVRLTQLKSAAEDLSALLQEVPKFDSGLWARIRDTPEGVGITDAIRQILIESKIPLTPVQVKDALRQSGLDTDYQNTMAVIHNTLKRLEKQGEVAPIRNAAGQTPAYTMRSKPTKRFGGPPVGEET